MLQEVNVKLVAGWGDGNVDNVKGIADTKSLGQLKELSRLMPELVEIVQPQPEFTDLIEQVKWWILGGDDKLYSAAIGLGIEEFAKFARKNVAPVGYQNQ